MGKRKFDVDVNALFSIKVLMGIGELKRWKDAGLVYTKFTGVEIPSSNLKVYAEKIIGKDVNTKLVEEFLGTYQKEVEKPLNYDPNKTLLLSGNTLVDYVTDNGAHTVQTALGITDEEKEMIFGIEEDDDGLTQKNKIIQKLNEPGYLIKYLKYDPNRFYLDKIDHGAWTVAMKLKIDEIHEIPVIVTNDRISFTIKQDPNITKDYIDLAEQLANVFAEKVKTIEFPNIVSAENLKDFRDYLVHQTTTDVHMGGLTHWTETSFDNWDSKIAGYRQSLITDFAIRKQQTEWRAKTLYIVYNGDILDIDNLFNKTSSMSNHTMQTDSRWNKIFADELAIILCSLVKLSPYFDDIYVDFNRGNHDKQTMDALFLAISTSILMSKINNVHTKYDETALLKESLFSWGNHLLISDHGDQASDDLLMKRLEQKYKDVMMKHRYVTVTAGHTHQYGVTHYGDKLLYREPSTCPPTNFEADETGLNGKANAAQMFKIWKKDERYPDVSTLEFERKSLWKDIESNITTPSSNMTRMQKSFFEQGLMSPTPKQIDAAKYFKSVAQKAKEAFQNKGMDTSKLTERDLVTMVESFGLEMPMLLRTEDRDFVFNNMPKILSLEKSS